MPDLILVRHGQSLWNQEKRFTGSVDVPLTAAGEAEAARAGELLQSQDLDVAYTSFLVRASRTLEILLAAAGRETVPVIRLAAFNERCYGLLEGRQKSWVRERYGAEIYRCWHRGYELAPPEGESLQQVVARVWEAFSRTAREDLVRGKNVLLVAHGNVLRSLVMKLENLSPAAVAAVELGNAVPLRYEFTPDLRLQRKTVLAAAAPGGR